MHCLIRALTWPISLKSVITFFDPSIDVYMCKTWFEQKKTTTISIKGPSSNCNYYKSYGRKIIMNTSIETSQSQLYEYAIKRFWAIFPDLRYLTRPFLCSYTFKKVFLLLSITNLIKIMIKGTASANQGMSYFWFQSLCDA